MKKFVAILLVAVMMISTLSITSFAAGSTTVSADRTSTITAKVRTYVSVYGELDANDSDTIMSVTISWDDVDFVFSETTKWNPETLEYDVIKSGWKNDGIANITVTNRSNCQITADVYFDKTNTSAVYENVDAAFDKDTALIDSGFEQTTAPSENFVLTVSGTPDTNKTVSTSDFGVITVTITGYNTPSSSVSGGSLDGNDNDT